MCLISSGIFPDLQALCTLARSGGICIALRPNVAALMRLLALPSCHIALATENNSGQPVSHQTTYTPSYLLTFHRLASRTLHQNSLRTASVGQLPSSRLPLPPPVAAAACSVSLRSRPAHSTFDSATNWPASPSIVPCGNRDIGLEWRGDLNTGRQRHAIRRRRRRRVTAPAWWSRPREPAAPSRRGPGLAAQDDEATRARLCTTTGLH